MKKELKLLSLLLSGAMACTCLAACGGNTPPDEEKFTLTYTANGGTGADITEEHAEGETVTLKGADTFVYEGHTLVAWTDGENEFATGAKFLMPGSDLTLSAKWQDDGSSAKPDKDAPAFTDADMTLDLTGAINTTNPEKAISPDLFGLFLEDINYASQGLDDNLVCNGSFENTQSDLADKDRGAHKHQWSENNGLTLEVQNGADKLHENNAWYGVISTSAGGTLTNAGYRAVPMYVRAKTGYTFSAFLRDYTGKLTVRIKNDSTVYAQKAIDVDAPSDSWIKISETLTPEKAGRNDLVLEIVFEEQDSHALIDAVQLETTDSTAGIKNYFYEAIADLSPAFFRFPGGCVIEGKSMDSAYDWKNSIGAVKSGDDDILEGFSYVLYENGVRKDVTTYGEWATRPQNINLWKKDGRYYSHEYGIGFYEYFLLCDSLGAKAIPILNCGFSCQPQTPNGPIALPGRHNKGVNDYIQDAIDLIEFAKGDTTTEWGKIRAQMGHEAPFEMDYIGIGNEQWGVYYTDYYEKFLQSEAFMDALKKYSVTPIVGNCTMFDHCENPSARPTVKGVAQAAATVAKQKGIVDTISDYGVVDQHYYVNYTDMLISANMYDSYLRPSDDPDNYYEVFVGEYAVNTDVVRAPVSNESLRFSLINNSWISALSEAAMMTGYERNGDIVKLAAYAPMFGTMSTNDRQWQVDMMYFDSEDILLTPNYYVQQLFMKNSGDYKISSHVTFASGTAPKTVYKATNNTTREADDIFFVTSSDAETGDIIVKIVNAGGKSFKTNINVAVRDIALSGVADVYEIVGTGADNVNTLEEEAIRPKKLYTIGFADSTVGFTVQPYSVTALRLHTK